MKRSAVDVDALVGSLLLAGTLTSIALIAAGIVWRRVVSGQLGFDYQIAGMTIFDFVLLDVRQLFAGELRPRLLANLGIAILMLTPYARVLASTAYFALVERNLKYTAFSGFVLVVLTYSLFLR
jgi:uncharacterized membrane protein